MNNKQVVLVTGSSEGIGQATAMAFYRSGAKVIFTGRSVKKLKILQKEIDDPSRALFEVIDFTDAKSCEQLVKTIIKKWKRIDILVNNCGGIPKKGQFLDLNASNWKDAFELNLMTTVTMSKLVIPFMKDSGGGRIVNVSSFTAIQPGSFNPHYSAMKAALINFGKHLSMQFAKDQILVNTVSPGHIQTEGWEAYIREKAARERREVSDVKKSEEERVVSQIPLHRFGTPQEVAELILFICSAGGRFLTGSNFLMDGGVIKGT